MRVFLFFILAISTWANESNYELDTVHVTHEDDGIYTQEDSATSDIINLESINNHQANSMDDILRLSSGATTAGGPRSSGEAVQVRGLDANKIYVYIDGARQNFSTDHSTMIAIDPEDIKAVKVNKSSSNFSHSGSLGGGIELKTKGARDYLKAGHEQGFLMKSSFQDANDEAMFSVKAFAIEGDSDYLLSMTDRDAKNTKTYDDQILENSAYKDQAALFKFNKSFSNNKLSFTYSFFNRKDEAPLNPTLDPPLNIRELNSKNEVKRNMGVLNFSRKSSKYQRELKGNISFTDQSLTKNRASDGRKELRNIKTLGLSFEDNFSPANSISLNIGHELNRDELKGMSNNLLLSSYPNGISSTLSNFIDFSYKPDQFFEYQLGLKTYFYNLSSDDPTLEDRDEVFLKKKLGLKFSPTKNLKFFGVYSEGLNTPKIQELYLDGFHFEGDDFYTADNYFIPNLELRPESSDTFEVGLTYEKSFFDLDLLKLGYSRYWTSAENYITLYQTFGDPWEEINGTTQAVNIPEARLYGQDLSFEYTYDFMTYKGSYSRIRGDNISEGIYLQRLSADTYLHEISFYLDKYNVNFGYLGLNTLKQDRVNPQTTQRETATNGYFVHSVFLNKRFERGGLKGLSFHSKVENLTNRSYRKHASNIDETGIDYKFGISYKVMTL